MTDRRMRPVLASVLVSVAALSCGKKEPAPAATPQPPTAPPAVTSLAPAPTTVPTPPPVWRAARWGMTREEVVAAFPGEAQPLAAPVPFTQPQPGSSLTPGSGHAVIPAYEADGAAFRVLFGIGPGGLDRIDLSAIKPAAGTCEDVEKALAARHGAPAQRATTGSSLKGEEITWRRPDQTVVLSCSGVASLGFLSVTLDYLPPAHTP